MKILSFIAILFFMVTNLFAQFPDVNYTPNSKDKPKVSTPTKQLSIESFHEYDSNGNPKTTTFIDGLWKEVTFGLVYSKNTCLANDQTQYVEAELGGHGLQDGPNFFDNIIMKFSAKARVGLPTSKSHNLKAELDYDMSCGIKIGVLPLSADMSGRLTTVNDPANPNDGYNIIGFGIPTKVINGDVITYVTPFWGVFIADKMPEYKSEGNGQFSYPYEGVYAENGGLGIKINQIMGEKLRATMTFLTNEISTNALPVGKNGKLDFLSLGMAMKGVFADWDVLKVSMDVRHYSGTVNNLDQEEIRVQWGKAF
jgi:hypothetical protein